VNSGALTPRVAPGKSVVMIAIGKGLASYMSMRIVVLKRGFVNGAEFR
jgi:hypothetical protein